MKSFALFIFCITLLQTSVIAMHVQHTIEHSSGSSHHGLEVSPESVVHFAQCMEQFLYDRVAPSTFMIPREQLVQQFDEATKKAKKEVLVPKERQDIKVTVQDKVDQMNYFLTPHYAMVDFVQICIAQRKDLAGVQAMIFEETGFDRWVEKEKKQLKMEYTRIGTTGFFYANRGSEQFGQRFPFAELLFKFWRRMAIPHGLAIKSAYFWIAKYLIEKMLSQAHGHGEQSNAPGLVSMQKIISRELANYNQILTYTYHNYYMEHRSNWEANEKVYFDSQYEHYKNEFADALTKVHVASIPAPANFDIAVTNVKRVIWVVRSVQQEVWEDKDFKHLDGNSKLAAAVEAAFENIKIDKLYVTQGASEKRNGNNLRTAQFILASGKNGNVKMEKVDENVRIKRVYQRGSPGTGDDDDLWSVEDVFTRILEENDGEGGDREDVDMEDVPESPESGHAHAHAVGSHSKAAAGAEVGVLQAAGEENAENIVVVTDLGASIALQQVFNGAYKYAAQGSVTKLVELLEKPKSTAPQEEHSGGSGKEPKAGGDEKKEEKAKEQQQQPSAVVTQGDALRQRIRLIFAGDTAHLGKLREDKAFMGVYWTK